MHISEAFPRTWTALSGALDNLGFRARDPFIVEMLVAELKAWERAESEVEHAPPAWVKFIFRGAAFVTLGAPRHTRFPHACALAEALLGRYRDEPSDPRFLA